MLHFCSHCHRDLPPDQFPPAALRKRDYRCLACFRIKNKEWRDKNPDATKRGARERMRKWREKNPGVISREGAAAARARTRAYYQANPHKKAAHRAVDRALKQGVLLRKPCEKCGAKRAHAHHDDYSKPLQVRWLCAKDHAREHRWIA